MLRTVAVILQDPVALFEFAIFQEVFGIDRTSDGVPPFELRVCSPTPDAPLPSGSGASVIAPLPLDAALDADLVGVPGGGFDGFAPDVLDTLRAVTSRGGRALSVCSGSFQLAAAGLLDGKRATTHWRYGAELARRYPQISVDTDVLFIDEGSAITSAGTAAGIDACLYLVREEYGAEVANRIARRMVVSPHRDGGQRQFVVAPMPTCSSDGFSETLAWAVENLHDKLSVSVLASRMHMSERTFARKFVDEVGTTPHRWLVEQRVLHARTLLESSQLSIEEVATKCGFGSATLLRHHFSSVVGVAPNLYRRRFATSKL